MYLFRTCNRCLIRAYFSPDSDKIIFQLKKAILSIEDSYKKGLNYELFYHEQSLWITYIICGLLWCVFVSNLDSHFDGTHSLQRIHCFASDVILNIFTYFPLKKQTHLHLGWPEAENTFILGIPLISSLLQNKSIFSLSWGSQILRSFWALLNKCWKIPRFGRGVIDCCCIALVVMFHTCLDAEFRVTDKLPG